MESFELTVAVFDFVRQLMLVSISSKQFVQLGSVTLRTDTREGSIMNKCIDNLIILVLLIVNEVDLIDN